MTTFEGLSNTQKVRAAIHRDAKAICSETLHFLGLEMTKSASDIVAELVYKKLMVYAGDLEAFSKHAKRNVINGEDVKLLVRRNPSLKSHLNKLVPTPQSASKDKRRKTKETTSKTSEEPSKTTEESTRTIEQSRKEDGSKEDTNRSKEKEMFEDDELDKMIVDDTIDLTFE